MAPTHWRSKWRVPGTLLAFPPRCILCSLYSWSGTLPPPAAETTIKAASRGRASLIWPAPCRGGPQSWKESGREKTGLYKPCSVADWRRLSVTWVRSHVVPHLFSWMSLPGRSPAEGGGRPLSGALDELLSPLWLAVSSKASQLPWQLRLRD